MKALLTLQVEFGEACTVEDDEISAYAALKDVIRGCLATDFLSRTPAEQAQRNLFNIIQHHNWSHDLVDAPELPEADTDSEADCERIADSAQQA